MFMQLGKVYTADKNLTQLPVATNKLTFHFCSLSHSKRPSLIEPSDKKKFFTEYTFNLEEKKDNKTEKIALKHC